MSVVDYITDWKERLRGRLYEQFADDPVFIALTELCGKQFQDLEDAAQTLITLPSIDDSEGVQLDVIGYLIGQLRLDSIDATYRLYLKARVIANRATGSSKDIYQMFRALFGQSVDQVYRPEPPKALTWLINTPITAAEAAVAMSFLLDVVDAGARVILEWQPEDDDNTFTFGNTVYLTAPASASDTTLTVTDTSSLPATGSVVIDLGTAGAETIAYTGKTATTLTLAAGVANAHAIGTTAEQVGDAGRGYATVAYTNGLQAAGTLSLVAITSMMIPFPASGTVIVDAGTENEEIKAYTSHSNTTITFASPTAKDHQSHAVIQLVANSDFAGGALIGALDA